MEGVVIVALLALVAAYFALRRQRRAHREESASPYKDLKGSKAGVRALEVSVGHACLDHSSLAIMFLSSLMAIYLVLRRQKRAHREDPAQPCKDCSFKARVLAFGGEDRLPHLPCSKGLHPQSGICCEVAADLCLLTEMGAIPGQ